MFYYYFLLVLLFLNLATEKSLFQSNFYTKILLIYMVVLVIVINIVNPLTADMGRYLNYMNVMENMSLFDSIVQTQWEPAFVTFQWVLSQLSTSYIFFISVTTSLILLIMITALKKIIPYNKIPLFMFGYLSFFSFYSLVNNILRQGFSVALLLLMLVFLEKNKDMYAVFLALIAFGFHTSALVGIILILLYKMKVPFKLYIYTFILSALTMVLNLNQKIISLVPFLFTNKIEGYLQQYTSESVISSYGETNRLDFLLFNVFWFILGLFFYKKYLYQDQFYSLVIKAYAVYGSIFFIFGFIGFSDRLAAYSWFLIPLILFYPILKINDKLKSLWTLFALIICILMMYIFDISDYFTFLNSY